MTERKPTKPWKRRLFAAMLGITLVFLACLGVMYLKRDALIAHTKAYLISQLDQATGGKTSIETLRVGFFPFRIIIRNLTLRGLESASAPPLLTIREARLQPRLRSLLSKLHFRAVELDRPQLGILVRPDGTTNLPHPASRLRELDLFGVIISRLKVVDGHFQFAEKRVGLDAEVRNFALSARYSSWSRSYRAEVAYENGSFQLGPLAGKHNLALVSVLTPGRLTIEKFIASAEQSRLQVQGWLQNLKSPDGLLQFEGYLGLGALKRFYPEISSLSGGAGFSGEFQISPHHWELRGKLDGKSLSFDTARINEIKSQFLIDPNRMQFDQIEATGLHGRSMGSFTVKSPFGSPTYSADFVFRDISLLDLSIVARLKKIRFAGYLDGTLKASWEKQWKGFAGAGHLRISEAIQQDLESQLRQGALPLSGQLNFALGRRTSSFENSYLQMRGNRVEFVGTLSPDQASNVRLEFRSQDLSELSFLLPELHGQASFIGTLQGGLDQPRLRGSLVAKNVSYERYAAEQVSGQVSVNRFEMDLNDVTVSRKNSRVAVQGKIFLNPRQFLPTGGAHLLLKMKDASLEDLYAMMGESFPASGLISGDFMVTGQHPRFNLQGVALMRQGQFYRQLFDSARAEIKFQYPALEIPEFQVRRGPGILRGAAQIDVQNREVHSRLAASNLPLAHIQAFHGSENTLNGTIASLGLQVDGPWRFPALSGHLDVKGLEFAGEPVGDFHTEFQTAKQLLQFRATSLSPKVRVMAWGTVELTENLALKSNVTFEEFGLSAYLSRILPAGPVSVSGQASGTVIISGTLRKPDQLVVAGTLKDLEMNFRETQVRASKPFDIGYQDHRLSIHDAALVGKGTSLKLDGSIDLARNKKTEMTLVGNFDLALLNEFVKKLKAKGNGSVNASIRGTLADPRLKGVMDINAEQLSYEGFPNSLAQVKARMFFDENQANLASLTGDSGGGKVQISGNVGFAQAQLRLINLKIEAHEVRFRYPEGMRNVVDADLNLRGSQQTQLLQGNIRILSAAFQKDYDPITEFLENRNQPFSVPGGKDLGDSLNLDLSVTGERNIRLETSLLKVASRADLKVKGTAGHPLITGSVEANEGDLYFQGTRYRITRGRIDFINPAKLDPRIDLEADTDVRDYRVVLTLSGTVDKFRADLRSDPPLSTMELFSLVSSGSAGAAANPSASFRPYTTTGRQQDNQLGATSLLSEGLSLRVGSRVKRIFGLDRFRVEPPAFLLGSARDPSARVTFGQQITRNLAITYSTSVSTNEQQVILVEFNVNDATSIIASRDSEGAFGLDVRFRKRLRQKNR